MDTASRLTVKTSSGSVEGSWQSGDSAAFLGIPFAQAPVGPLRFAPPARREPWDGVRPCLDYGPTAQRRPLGEVTAIPEPSIPGDDYLVVNVFTPAPGDELAHLPVMVWIHGGGYTAGSPASPWYNGRSFNRDGIVTVTISYRLGFVGFGHVDGAPANRGVLDWLAALTWVQENIARFGGDPSNVTVAGQSAGGGAVLTLLASRASNGLFHRAISHSGVPNLVPPDAARHVASRLAALCGIEPVRTQWEELDETILVDAQTTLAAEAMKAKPEDMLGAMIRRESSLLTLAPQLDGELITGETAQQLSAGIGSDVALIAGSTASEFNMIATQMPKIVNLLPPSMLLRRGGLDKLAARAYVNACPTRRTADLLGQFLTDMSFHVPLVEVAAVHAATWVYLFDWPSPAAGGSSPHCLDLPFAWDLLDADHVEYNTGPNPPQAVADAMHGAWVRFIKDGDPGWPTFAPNDHQAMVFNVPTTVSKGAYARERALLDALP